VQETSWDEAMTLARRAIYDTDGRGMVGRGRNHLIERVARLLIQRERRVLDISRRLRYAADMVGDDELPQQLHALARELENLV